MANQIQRLMYEGYLAEDPDMRYTPSGKSVTNFRMGSNRSYKNSNDEVVKETTWLKVTAWGKLGEIVSQLCAKGAHVIVEGILRVGENGSPNVYPLKNGEYGASYEVTASSVRVLDGKKPRTESGESAPSDEPADNSDIPF
jgi:single-strand DNA-binding protein